MKGAFGFMFPIVICFLALYAVFSYSDIDKELSKRITHKVPL